MSTSGKPDEDLTSLARRDSISSCRITPVKPVTSTGPVDKGGVSAVVETGMPELRSPEKEKEKWKIQENELVNLAKTK